MEDLEFRAWEFGLGADNMLINLGSQKQEKVERGMIERA
jgi:hypothetical protein